MCITQWRAGRVLHRFEGGATRNVWRNTPYLSYCHQLIISPQMDEQA